MGQVEKTFLLRTLDQLWRDHIITVEQLRQVIHLRGYGQRDPLNEYKTEGFNLFETMVNKLRENVTAQVMRVEIQMQAPPGLELPDEDELPLMAAHHLDATTGEDDVGEGLLLLDSRNKAVAALDPRNPATWGKVSRNEPCPCGSGKKYKHCHGAYA
jgi:preprotein translocase subunit SecA